ncbi:MAG: toll/interleukin-1 receptor domain-containing protein [Bacteroidota bacterium]
MIDYKDIFLSHRSSNKDVVRQLVEDIEDPERYSKYLTTWFDEAEIKPGQSITGLVNKGLEQSRFFGIVMSPAYFDATGSCWTDAEWHAALFSDPDNRNGRIIPLLIEDCPYMPPLLKHLRYIDLREVNYEQGLKELTDLLIDKPRPKPRRVRGQIINANGTLDKATLLAERSIPQSEPDAVNEKLFSNLFPVVKLPEFVYLATISDDLVTEKKDGSRRIPSKTELKEILMEFQLERGDENPFSPAFRCYKDQIYTFHDLHNQSSPLRSTVDQGTISRERIGDLLNNEDYYNIIVSLLNMAISRHLYRCRLIADDTKYARYYFPSDDGDPNVISYKSFKKSGSRTVAKPILDDEGNAKSWIHQGAYIRLLQLGKKFYLLVNPTWVLTSDGITPAGGKDVAKTVNKWTNAERNDSIVRHNKFWSVILSSGKRFIEIYAGDQVLKIDSDTAIANMPVGIMADHIKAFDKNEEASSIDEFLESTLSDDDFNDVFHLENFDDEQEEYDYEDYDLGDKGEEENTE